MHATVPPDTPETPTHPRPLGSRQGGQRAHNERAVLQAVRLHGALPAVDIARLTGLTAQTVSMIGKRLLDEGLLLKGAPQRGKVGQPAVPLSLNPEGAWAVGLNVGRRGHDMLLVDFTGRVHQRWALAETGPHTFPDPDTLLADVHQRLQALPRLMGAAAHTRLQGVGIAAPLHMHGWQSLLGLHADLAARWSSLDLHAEVARRSHLPVSLLKDTAAAGVAELVQGRGRQVPSFLYVFVDTFVGGSLVIDGQWHGGRQGNAGAVGSMPLGLSPVGAGQGEAPGQLLSQASLLNLEQRLRAAGLDTGAANDDRALRAPFAQHTTAWLQHSANALALAVHNATSLLDLDGVIVDGAFSRDTLAALLTALAAAMDGYRWEGVQRPHVLAGTIGPDARALGAALLPLHANFTPDPRLFLQPGR